jgi:hypothetical protein
MKAKDDQPEIEPPKPKVEYEIKQIQIPPKVPCRTHSEDLHSAKRQVQASKKHFSI